MNNQDIKNKLNELALILIKNSAFMGNTEDGQFGWYVGFPQGVFFIELVQSGEYKGQCQIVCGNRQYMKSTLDEAIKVIWEEEVDGDEKVEYLEETVLPNVLDCVK